jgi:hypothetical protein
VNLFGSSTEIVHCEDSDNPTSQSNASTNGGPSSSSFDSESQGFEDDHAFLDTDGAVRVEDGGTGAKIMVPS